MSKRNASRAIARDEQATAWELRGHWIAQRPVVLTLTPRCEPRRLEGVVEHVSVTGATCEVAGYHVPVADVLAVARPHFSQR